MLHSYFKGLKIFGVHISAFRFSFSFTEVSFIHFIRYHYMIILALFCSQNPCSEMMKFTVVIEGFFVYKTMQSVFSSKFVAVERGNNVYT